MDLEIAGRKAVVTGADSGIGYATARELLAEGATVVLTDREAEKLAAAATSLDVDNDRMHTCVADITSRDSVQALKDEVNDKVGTIDILIQAAGIHGTGGSFGEITEADWQHTLDVDLMGQVR